MMKRAFLAIFLLVFLCQCGSQHPFERINLKINAGVVLTGPADSEEGPMLGFIKNIQPVSLDDGRIQFDFRLKEGWTISVMEKNIHFHSVKAESENHSVATAECIIDLNNLVMYTYYPEAGFKCWSYELHIYGNRDNFCKKHRVPSICGGALVGQEGGV